jgi:hypothetical protein
MKLRIKCASCGHDHFKIISPTFKTFNEGFLIKDSKKTRPRTFVLNDATRTYTFACVKCNLRLIFRLKATTKFYRVTVPTKHDLIEEYLGQPYGDYYLDEPDLDEPSSLDYDSFDDYGDGGFDPGM